MPKNRLTERRSPDWVWDFSHEAITLRAKECTVSLYSRPRYCDRGQWIAYVIDRGYPTNPSPFDASDAFPRYYFDLRRAQAEIEALFNKRGYNPTGEHHDRENA